MDFFRGLALWLIFIDHIPYNLISWITIRNYGFSDAAELFVFISGYTAAFVYGRAMQERGFVPASARILKRVWQIYVAHIFLFMVFLAQIVSVTRGYENPLFVEEMGIVDFLQRADIAVLQAVLLTFKPVNMDILPVYILLLIWFPLVLWLLLRSPTAALTASALLYVLADQLHWNLPAYPSGQWVINPYCWQLLFVFGAWCALYGANRLSAVLRSRITLGVAVSYLVFAFAIVMTWYFPRLGVYVPRWLGSFLYPIDKTNLDVLRFAHFLALTVLVLYFVPREWRGWQWPALRPIIFCGKHSLEIFCLGIFLSFAGHFIMVEISSSLIMQFVITIGGLAILSGTAWLLSWYKKLEQDPVLRRQAATSGDIAGSGP
ncbi:MAG TPA: OpgC domain-containing protein [Mesorhizobium sp.]|nr:OpgC domain-containing protein [Mesorhizobium sp.]